MDTFFNLWLLSFFLLAQNVTRQVLIKNVYVDTEPETIRIANLLGVAGIDVPIKEIEKLTPSFKVCCRPMLWLVVLILCFSELISGD